MNYCMIIVLRIWGKMIMIFDDKKLFLSFRKKEFVVLKIIMNIY